MANKNYNQAITFYSSLVNSTKADIDQISLDMQQGVQRYPRENESILASDSAALFSYEMKLICAKYSCGLPFLEIEQHFNEAVNCLNEVDQNNLGYTNILWLTALGILFEANEETFKTISTKAISFNDSLLDYLFQFTGINYPYRSCGFYKAVPYSEMQKIIELPEEKKDYAVATIQDYINNKWFIGHRDYGWENAHKRMDYVGFWSFECAAIVKLLHLDESKIICPQHYPYGLAGYRNESVFANKPLLPMQDNNTVFHAEKDDYILAEQRKILTRLHTDWRNLSPIDFYKRYQNKLSIDQVWSTYEEFSNDNNQLGKIALFYLSENGALLQVDAGENVDTLLYEYVCRTLIEQYHEDISTFRDYHIDRIKEELRRKGYKLISFNLQTDNLYIALAPASLSFDEFMNIPVKDF